jgi:hypothetical protein
MAVMIGYSQDRDSFPSQQILKSAVEPGFVNGFHHKNEVRPLDLIGRQRDFSVIGKTCGVGLYARVFTEDLFCRGAAELVSRADEKDVFHSMRMVAANGSSTFNSIESHARERILVGCGSH